MTDNLVMAKKLREEGFTYKQIVEELGVTIGWCKYNLKGVKSLIADKYIKEIKDNCLIRGGVNFGIGNYQAKGIIFKHFENISYDRSLYLMNKAKASGVLIRPDWVNLNKPLESYTTMLTDAMDINYYIEDKIDDYIRGLDVGEFDRPNRNAVKREMLSLALGAWVSKERLGDRVVRNEAILNEIPKTEET